MTCASSKEMEALNALRKQLLLAMKLKELPRAGWLRVGVDSPESVAAHSWGVAYLVLALSPSVGDIDVGQALKIAVIHDLAETTTGDITPHDGIDRSEKARCEAAALEALVAPLDHRDELMQLWKEFEEGSTPEARFVRACDKLDMALQAQRYRREQGISVEEFILSALAEIEEEELRALVTVGRTTLEEDREPVIPPTRPPPVPLDADQS